MTPVENTGAPPGPRPARATELPGLTRSRAALLEMLLAQSEPTGLTALAASAELHENTVRGHLDGLQRAGLVTREKAEPDGRGRPAWLWRAVDADPPSEYAGLAGALAATLHRTSDDPARDATVAGRAWGRQLATGRPSGEPNSPRGRRRAVVELMDHLGFEPQADVRAQQVRLTRCPLLEVAKQHTEVVCNVHAGLVQGALAEYGDETADVTLLPFAEPGACLLHLRENTP